MDETEVLSAPPPSSKKSSKKLNKHHHSSTPSKLKHGASNRPQPPSFARAQSPTPAKGSSRNQDRFSGLWEWYFDKDEGTPPMGDREGEGPHRDDGTMLKNIRGFLMKRRKSPLKGWHKRYFVVEKGFLYFSRTYSQMVKGKLTGSLDLGLSFIHCDGSSRRINIDGDHHVIHLKTKNASHFAAWSSCIIAHEMHRKTQLASGKTAEGKGRRLVNDGAEDGPSVSVENDVNALEEWVGKTQRTISGIKKDLDGIHEGLEAMALHIRSPRGSGLQTTPSSSSNALASMDKFQYDPLPSSDTSSLTNGSASGSDKTDASSGGTIPKKKFAIRKAKKDKKKESTSNLSPEQPIPTSAVLPNTAAVMLDEQMSVSSGNASASDQKDDFTAVAKLVYAQFCEVMEKLEKLDGGLQQAAEQSASQLTRKDIIISNQLLLLRQTMLQNTELRDRLAQIQTIASGSESKVHMSTPVGTGMARRTPSQSYHRTNNSIPRFDSFMSLHSTLSDKFFDALDQVHEFSSSEDEAENSDDEESGEESDTELFSSITQNVLTSISLTPTRKSAPTCIYDAPIQEEEESGESSSHDASPDPALEAVVRRRKLPAPISDMADFSLWSLLRKNIGKDLSKISMPVSMNEPLSALQRLCEELEYTELLDQATACSDPFDRMVRVAAFAVSSYALAYHRAGRKPFNPILGETYECVREDKGFKFIAEQVSHHPPIAACHCLSSNFEFWQDARIKSKFWGKSMEVFPIGVTNVLLPKHGDHYQWKKVTSCIHNVLGGQRWVDQYGEMTITNKDICSCKLTFVKASYWTSKKCVVYGDVYDADGSKVRHMFGAWNEAMFCGNEGEEASCIWRVAKMPAESEEHYGFSHFAIELNELLEGQRDELPCTDCRFRPDQRLLEDGHVQDAESEKRRVEQIQREARAERERLGEDWTPNFFTRVEDEAGGHYEKWISNGTYWTHRESRFRDIDLPALW